MHLYAPDGCMWLITEAGNTPFDYKVYTKAPHINGEE